MLAAHSAPEHFLSENTVRFINGLASGHPLLITFAARFLRDRDWQLDDKGFESLIRGEHATGITDEVINRICQSLQTSQRELLYRLSLAIGFLKEVVALELAGVDPAIDRPRECLAALIGAWIQREAKNKLAISPLVRGIASGNLSDATRMQCHVTLGDSITRSPMGAWDANIAIGHFVQAREFDRAGILFLLLLDRLRVWQVLPELRSVISMWCDLSLPEQMDLGLRIKIRSMQFWVFPKYGKSDDFVLSDLDDLMDAVTKEHAWSAQIVASLAALFLAARDYPRTIRYLTRSFAVLRDADIRPNGLRLPEGKQPVELLWTVIVNITNVMHVEQWITAFESLSADERRIVTESRDATLGCVVFADRLMLVEMRKPANEQDWTSVLKALQRLQASAEEFGWEHLAASALKSEVNVHGEFLKNVEICESQVRAFVDDDSRGQQAKSLVSGMYGKMLAGSGEHDKALPWLEIAIHTPTRDLAHDQMMTLLAAAKSCAASDREGAIRYAQGAADIARMDRALPDVEATKAFGELAIAVVSRNPTREGAIQAYPAWSEAAERMLLTAKRDNEWKDSFVLFGHIHSYLVQLATIGKPPEQSLDGGPYAPPQQGMFFTSHPQRIDYYRDEHVAGNMWFMSQYARSAHDEKSASEWARRATDAIDGMPQTHVTASIRSEMIPDLLNADEFAEAMDAGIGGSEAMVAVKEVAEKQQEAIPHDTPLESLVAQLSSEGRKSADRFVIISAVVPAFLRIGCIAMSDRATANIFAAQTAALSRQASEGATDRRFFLGSAQILDKISDEATLHAFRELAHSFDTSQYQELRVLGYLASTLAADPKSAFAAQLASMQTVFSWYPPDSATHTKLLVPYIETFWTTSFRERRFQFRSPSLIEQELASATTADRTRKVRAILHAVRPGVRTVGLDDSLEWLDRDE